jgi:predicted amidohydrolase YtcJ
LPGPRTLLTGTIRTSSSTEPVDWLSFANGTVEATGGGEPPDELVSTSTRLELPAGAVAVPVLHDAHVHLLGTGLLELGVDLSDVPDVEGALDRIRTAASGFDGRLLRAHSLDPDVLAVPRYPTIGELDAAAGGVPAIVRRRDGHSSAANTAALELFGIGPGTDGLEVDACGRATGTLRRRAHSAAAAASADLLTRDERVRALHLGARSALRAGAGVVHALVGRQDPEDREIELTLEVRDELPVDVVIYPQTTDVERVASLGLPRIGGCILLDGSFGSWSAALGAPYADADGAGTLYFDDDTLTGFLRKAHGRGMQVALHAIGDRAIAQAARCLGATAGGEAPDARHRVEHCELPGVATLADLRRMGAGICVQPAFETYWGGAGRLYERRLGPERMRRTNPFRTMLDMGLHLGGGSDSYVTPIDPLGGMAAACSLPNAEHSMTPREAFDLFTSGAAWLAFDEHRVGTLVPGAEASFTVLDGDPIAAGPRAGDIHVLGVYLRGEPAAGGKSAA